jgi:hypothetical protein
VSLAILKVLHVHGPDCRPRRSVSVVGLVLYAGHLEALLGRLALPALVGRLGLPALVGRSAAPAASHSSAEQGIGTASCSRRPIALKQPLAAARGPAWKNGRSS